MKPGNPQSDGQQWCVERRNEVQLGPDLRRALKLLKLRKDEFWQELASRDHLLGTKLPEQRLLSSLLCCTRYRIPHHACKVAPFTVPAETVCGSRDAAPLEVLSMGRLF